MKDFMLIGTLLDNSLCNNLEGKITDWSMESVFFS